jgi:hypothetical protein
MTDSKPSNLELTARVVLPSLTLIAFVVKNLYDKWPLVSWILISFGLFFSFLSYYSALRERLIKWKSLWDDRQAAKRAFPEFQEFVRRFATFVNRQSGDSLHYIVESDICGSQPALRADCQLPNIDIWIVPHLYFSERLDRQPKTMKELRPALIEFHYLVASYNNFCVAPIFDVLPANIRARITPPVLAKLNLFQQNFRSYLEGYQLFVERLAEARPILKGVWSTFNTPKPIV